MLTAAGGAAESESDEDDDVPMSLLGARLVAAAAAVYEIPNELAESVDDNYIDPFSIMVNIGRVNNESASAIIIQRMFRGYIFRKFWTNPSIPTARSAEDGSWAQFINGEWRSVIRS